MQRPYAYLIRAARAASYPLRGIWYFLRNKEFYPLFLGRLLPLTIISVLIYTILFTFAFLPQLALLAIFQGKSAWLNATILVLGEGLILIQGLFEGFFVDETRVDVFDVSLRSLSPGLQSFRLTHQTGYPHQVLVDRSRISPQDSLPRRAYRCQDAGQTHKLCHLHSLEHHPDRRARRLPAPQLHPHRGCPRVHHDHWYPAGKACALPLVPAAGARQEGEQTGKRLAVMGVRVVWHRVHDP